MDAFWTALVIGLFAMLGPVLLSRSTGRQLRKQQALEFSLRHQERLEDYARQDAVKQQAEEAAALLLAANERVASQSAEASEATHRQLQQIHVLVNSNMTAAMRSELDARKAQLTMTLEVVDLKEKQGMEPTAEALAEIASMRAKIAELESTLGDRIIQTVVADAELGESEGP